MHFVPSEYRELSVRCVISAVSHGATVRLLFDLAVMTCEMLARTKTWHGILCHGRDPY